MIPQQRCKIKQVLCAFFYFINSMVWYIMLSIKLCFAAIICRRAEWVISLKGTFTVSLKQIINSFNLESLYLPKDSSEIYISSSAVNRPILRTLTARSAATGYRGCCSRGRLWL